MDEIAFIGLLVTGAAYVAHRAFARPRGVYWRSAAGALATPLVAALIWHLAQPSNAAGLGAFFLWAAATGLGVLIALVACAAATARYAVDALRSEKP